MLDRVGDEVARHETRAQTIRTSGRESVAGRVSFHANPLHLLDLIPTGAGH